MKKIAVAANDDCTVADSIENPPSLVVYEVNDRQVLKRTIRYFRHDVFEALTDCQVVIGKSCSDDFKMKLSEKGLEPIFTEEESADGAVGRLLDLKWEEGQGTAEQTCRH